jgi:membrane protein YdbS with pleckstrin-like domain
MDDFDKLQQRIKLTEASSNFKMVIVGVLLVSVVIFTVMGEAEVRPIIWEWATGMLILVAIAVALDIRDHFRLKKLGLK